MQKFSPHTEYLPPSYKISENPLTESTVSCGRLDGWTDGDMTTPIFAFHKFVNASKNHLELISFEGLYWPHVAFGSTAYNLCSNPKRVE